MFLGLSAHCESISNANARSLRGQFNSRIRLTILCRSHLQFLLILRNPRFELFTLRERRREEGRKLVSFRRETPCLPDLFVGVLILVDLGFLEQSLSFSLNPRFCQTIIRVDFQYGRTTIVQVRPRPPCPVLLLCVFCLELGVGRWSEERGVVCRIVRCPRTPRKLVVSRVWIGRCRLGRHEIGHRRRRGDTWWSWGFFDSLRSWGCGSCCLSAYL